MPSSSSECVVTLILQSGSFHRTQCPDLSQSTWKRGIVSESTRAGEQGRGLLAGVVVLSTTACVTLENTDSKFDVLVKLT